MFEHKPPVLEKIVGGRFQLSYETFSDKGDFITHTLLRGTLEEIIEKVVASHRSASQAIARYQKKLGITQEAGQTPKEFNAANH
jgi:hypothetical protein